MPATQAQGRRRLQKEATREHIIKTATAVYARRGFSAPTSVIAQEAGLSHGSIFVHFPTRESLQLSVLERFAHDLGDSLHGLSLSGGGIEELLHAHVRVLKAYEPFYKNVISEASSLPQETMSLLISVQSAASYHIGAAIEEGKREGAVKDIPLSMLFNAWMGLLHYYLQNSELFAPGASVLDRYEDELVDGFVRLIST